MGIHPHYVIGVWVGFDDHRLLNKEYYSLSKQLFKSAMDALYNEKEDIWYQPSANLEVKTVDPIQGKQQSKGSEYWFKR